MRAHLDLLGRLYLVWGVFGLLTGGALVILAFGAAGEGGRLRLGALILAAIAAVPLSGGAACVWTGRALGRRSSRGRRGALLLGVPNLFLLPFGTALGIYSYWVLLNDQVRAIFEERDAT